MLKCINAQMHGCTDAQTLKCANAPKDLHSYACNNAQIHECSNAHMLKCTSAQIGNCTSTNAGIHKRTNAKLLKYTNVQMGSCTCLGCANVEIHDAQMLRWHFCNCINTHMHTHAHTCTHMHTHVHKCTQMHGRTASTNLKCRKLVTFIQRVEKCVTVVEQHAQYHSNT